MEFFGGSIELPTMKSTGVPAFSEIAVIGGGYSGAMLSVELLRRGRGRCSIVLVEKSSVPGLGAAYGTTCRDHLPNVRANSMSAYADMPDHFEKWAKQNYSVQLTPDDFLPRAVYGKYIASQVREAAKARDSEFHCLEAPQFHSPRRIATWKSASSTARD
jgi:uncharacterized NAD(P)/FAD-binding protein YdhS